MPASVNLIKRLKNVDKPGEVIHGPAKPIHASSSSLPVDPVTPAIDPLLGGASAI